MFLCVCLLVVMIMISRDPEGLASLYIALRPLALYSSWDKIYILAALQWPATDQRSRLFMYKCHLDISVLDPHHCHSYNNWISKWHRCYLKCKSCQHPTFMSLIVTLCWIVSKHKWADHLSPEDEILIWTHSVSWPGLHCAQLWVVKNSEVIWELYSGATKSTLTSP